MKLLKANLKNIVHVFRKGGPQFITGEPVLPGMIYFLPKRAYDNGHISFDRCDNSLGRAAFNRMTRKQVKAFITEDYNHHYLLW